MPKTFSLSSLTFYIKREFALQCSGTTPDSGSGVVPGSVLGTMHPQGLNLELLLADHILTLLNSLSDPRVYNLEDSNLCCAINPSDMTLYMEGTGLERLYIDSGICLACSCLAFHGPQALPCHE